MKPYEININSQNLKKNYFYSILVEAKYHQFLQFLLYLNNRRIKTKKHRKFIKFF